MAIFAKDTKREWTPAPEGLHQSVCVDVVDLGLVKTAYGEKHKARIVWQIEEVNPDTGKRFDARRDFTLSLNEKGHLRPFLEAWRGRKFTKEELEGFDLEKLVGVACQVQIVHNISDEGTTYANVQAVVAPAKGVPKISPMDYVRVKDRSKEQGTGQSEDENESVPF